MLEYVMLIAGFSALIKGADLLVNAANSLAEKFNISKLVIGLTLVAFGTSAPELFVNVLASIKGNTDIAIGNVLGSNIANVFLILGISAIIYPLKMSQSTVWKEIPFSLLAGLVLGVLVSDKIIDKNNMSVLTRTDGMILIFFFFMFIYYSINNARVIEVEGESATYKTYGLLKTVLLLIISLILLGLGAVWVVDSAVRIALNFGLSESAIALTIVALGTSLPELATSAVAAYKKNSDIAVGNVIGSNIFNIFFVLGISSIITPLAFNAEIAIDVLITILTSFLLFIFMFTGHKHRLDRWEGVVSVCLYGGYIAFVITR